MLDHPFTGQLLRLGNLARCHHLGSVFAVLRGPLNAALARNVEPFVRLHIILSYAFAIIVADAKVVLSSGITLLGC